ncbi:MAG: hypothetical protein IPJ00_12085 [Saprospirales bacterium]|nr:hypothetical protein [Saprospirales bacterium]
MKVVIDTNILVSTLISSDGIVGSFLLKDLQDVEKLSCYYLYVELFDKKEKMLKVSGLAESDFFRLNVPDNQKTNICQ